jgi:hypothetical protein
VWHLDSLCRLIQQALIIFAKNRQFRILFKQKIMKNYYVHLKIWILRIFPLFLFFSCNTQASANEKDEYYEKIKFTNENVNSQSTNEVIQKIGSRFIIRRSSFSSEARQFGLHGMEAPFATSTHDKKKMERAYSLLAKAGVERFRTAESTWHRLSENFSNYTELDFQVNHAKPYGMDFMFTVGYPPAKFNVGAKDVSTFKPQYESLFRRYIRQLLLRYKGIVKDIEVGNEVDYPSVWWVGGTSKEYVRDVRIVKEEAMKIDPKTRVVAFAATGSRKEGEGGLGGGRQFVKQAFDYGIDKYADAYSLHYVWTLEDFPFISFFRSQLSLLKSNKPLINSEDTGFSRPSDIIKIFARSLYLYGYQRVDYFLARDYFEGGKLIYSGLFDIDWNPKQRLLAYATSYGAMKNRTLVGVAEPSPGIEAYVLRNVDHINGKNITPFSIIMWQSENFKVNETYSPWTKAMHATDELKLVKGLYNVKNIFNWKLDQLRYRENQGIRVGLDPVIVFCNKLPKWKLLTQKQWIERKISNK